MKFLCAICLEKTEHYIDAITVVPDGHLVLYKCKICKHNPIIVREEKEPE